MKNDNFIKFTEKYRPRNLNDISGNLNILKCLKSFDVNNLPNLLFYGPSGIGKTTAIKALIYKKINELNILELNASDDRGINIVRNQIKQFAETSNDFRIVILDEVDSMSKDAQGALRRIMEDYPNCRFCLICNYIKNIIDPIQSRCTKFRFSPIKDLYIKSYILKIINNEGIKVEDINALELLISNANGDMRKLINNIQGIKKTYNIINTKIVNNLINLTNQEKINKILTYLLDNNLPFKKTYDLILDEDVECEIIMNEIFKKILNMNISNKFTIIKGLSNIEIALSKGCNNKIQLSALVGLFK